ncbi:hypothetical protein [Candidatus Pelagisphaera phototrophica]|uniref:hypothetical protein n=1 Tax=Candidatus Pelagisphaera phototrophica TaxID=2684113 RepID=UPI0019EE416B|nr:hypothetical protein [Candidatus Pelagisphaera phototrophica]QXD31245.1 hypothetical protein GA004_13005 [Candidatus Pelagisphaera phototrophica]
MNLSESVKTNSDEAKTTDSRASRMARYSAAAAGVAAVSSTEVDAALVTVDLGSPVGPDTPIDISSAGHGELSFFLIFHENFMGTGLIAAGSNANNGSSAAVSNWVGPNQQIGPSHQVWSDGGFIGPALSNETAYVGFRVPEFSSSSFTYGYLQFDFDSSQNATVQHWGYESVVNTAVTTPGGSSSVPDTGPGLFGIALLGAGAAGMRLLRKLRVGI